MPLDEFTFSLAFNGATEGPVPRLDEAESRSGVDYGRSLDAVAPFRAEGVVVLDGTDGNTYDEWYDFMEDHGWGADAVLYRARGLAKHYAVKDLAIGTATGGAGNSFLLPHRDIEEGSIEVRVGSVVQPPSEWDLVNNNTAPAISTLAGFDAGAVKISYRFYHRVRVVLVDAAIVRVDRDGAPASVRPRVRIVQTSSGGHLA